MDPDHKESPMPRKRHQKQQISVENASKALRKIETDLDKVMKYAELVIPETR